MKSNALLRKQAIRSILIQFSIREISVEQAIEYIETAFEVEEC